MGIIWIIVIFAIVVFLFGKNKEWEYEAKLIVEGEYNIVGEVEIKKFAKENPKGELKIYPVPLRVEGDYDIIINGQRVAQVRYPSGTRKVLFEVSDTLRIRSNDEVEVVVPGVKSLRGVFHRD